MFINKKRFKNILITKEILTYGYKQKQIHINRGSIGALIGVHVSSIVKLSRQFQACLLLLFFYEEICRTEKHSQANINQENKIKQTRNNKGNNFSCA